jgi:hypothetical protein
MDDRYVVKFYIRCTSPNQQLSTLAQICSLSLPPIPTLEHLVIHEFQKRSQDDMESAQWLEILQPFTYVTSLVFNNGIAELVAPALEGLTVERTIAILPALHNLVLKGWQPSEPVTSGIAEFVATRKFSGHPVTILYEI